eukprot:9471794-Pyramimonas_sp.AAC.1
MAQESARTGVQSSVRDNPRKKAQTRCPETFMEQCLKVSGTCPEKCPRQCSVTPGGPNPKD